MLKKNTLSALFVLGLFVPTVSQAVVPTLEREALVALYNQTNGENWSNNSNWLNGDPCEQAWAGVRCNADNSHVTWLSLSGNNLVGTIPSQVGDLDFVEWLDMSFNGLEGPIPPEIGDMEKLQYLILESNRLSGALPSQLGDLTQLMILELRANQLTGAIPPELGGLSSLMTLNLAQNQLSGYIPNELGQLQNLEALYLGSNEFTGPFPLGITQLVGLKKLYLNNNKLEGPIPPEIGRLSRLQELDLSNNRFYGELPSEIGTLADLEWLLLNSNNFSGMLPESFEQLSLDVYSFKYNALYTDNPNLAMFLEENTQTLPPSNVTIVETTAYSFTLQWDVGQAPEVTESGYQIFYGTDADDGFPYGSARIPGIENTTGVLEGLMPDTRYCVVVRTWSAPNEQWNLNEVWSADSNQVCATVAAGASDRDGDGRDDSIDNDACNAVSPFVLNSMTYSGIGDTRLFDAEQIETAVEADLSVLSPHELVLTAPIVRFLSGAKFKVENGAILRVVSQSQQCPL